MDLIQRLFSSDGFMPHGHCYFWNPSLLWLHTVSDALITLAYLTTLIALVYIVRRRKDVPFDWIFACFGIFIVACGVTHAMEIWSIWHPTYWLSGSLKALTAAASVATAVLLTRLVPQLLAIPSADILRRANQALESEVAERQRAEEAHAQLAMELRRERQRLDEILNSVPAVIFEHHLREVAGSRPDFVSTHIEKMLGYSREEWLATPDFWFTRVHPDDRESVAANSAEVFAGRSTKAVLFRWLAKDGRVVSNETYLVHIRDEAGQVLGVRGFTLDVTERMQAASEMERLNKQLVDVSRQAGMAEVATSVLHNIGNVLNSVNVSCSVISDKVRKSRIGSVAKAAELLRDHAADLAAFFARDPAGQKLPDFLGKLAARLSGEQASVLEELRHLGQNIEHIKDIVSMQQNYATVSGVTETVSITDLVEDSLRMNAGALTRHEVQPVREYGEVPPITVEKHKVLQILVNLIRNAKYACDESGRADKQLAVRVSNGHDHVRIAIIDNGVGIRSENLERIFAHGFTTRKDGHGFGLHSAVLAAQEMGGRLTVHSDGPGTGATFTLELPLHPPAEKTVAAMNGTSPSH